MVIDIDDDNINSLVKDGLRKAIEMAKHAHFTDLDIRINGENVRLEADWIKYMVIRETHPID